MTQRKSVEYRSRQSDQSCLGVGWILQLGFVTRPKRSTYTDGPRHYCHVLAQYCLLQRFFSQLERKVFPLRSWRSLSNNGFDPSRSRDHREREISSVAPLHTYGEERYIHTRVEKQKKKQNKNNKTNKFMLTCEDKLDDKRRHVSTSISSERPSGLRQSERRRWPLCASLCLSEALCASLGLSGSLL